MGDEIRVGYFLEDLAQSELITVLVERLAEELGVEPSRLEHHVRNSTGGKGRVRRTLRQFLRDVVRGATGPFDVTIVCIDADCDSVYTVKREILQLVDQTGYPGAVVCAIPDPHVERWYLADPDGFCRATGIQRRPTVPKAKCERDQYKAIIVQCLREEGVPTPLGGAEYGADIAREMNVGRATSNDKSLSTFRADLREALAHFRS